MRYVCGILLVGVLSTPLFGQSAPVVTNVLAEQIPGTKQVRITYGVNDADGDLMSILVRISFGGEPVPDAVSFTGDVSDDIRVPAIASGTGKEIIWDAEADLGEVSGTDWQAEVIARDGDGLRLEVVLPGGATMEFRWIPPGTFLMGSPDSDPDAAADEKPQHHVTISEGFYLGTFEVTQAQWESVMTGSNPSDPSTLPKENISWEGSQQFIRQLNNAATGSEVYRLPTEAEWEYACRAGTTTPWSFGDDHLQLGMYAWYLRSSNQNFPHPVGMLLQNPWGLFDMYGNVMEFCQDLHGPYSAEAQVDPRGPLTGEYRVVRGGYYEADFLSTRSASRAPGLAPNRFTGFRVLREGP